jgi:hypothetical protein
VLENRQVKCWGANSNGQLGIRDTDNRGDSANHSVRWANNVTIRQTTPSSNRYCAAAAAGLDCTAAALEFPPSSLESSGFTCTQITKTVTDNACGNDVYILNSSSTYISSTDIRIQQGKR